MKCRIIMLLSALAGGLGLPAFGVAMLLVGPAEAWSSDTAGMTMPPAKPYKAAAGPHAVEVVNLDWTDEARGRPVPIRIYLPRETQRPCPVIILSHGLGGSRAGYEFLGRHWASHGYASVHLQHKGSDTEVWKGKGQPMESMRGAANVQNALDRPKDVRFAVDRLTALNAADGALEGRLDLEKLGISGHSFGANTTLVIAGQSLGIVATSYADTRFKAAIPMSAPVPALRGRLDEAYRGVRIPCLHMTGTLDDSPVGETGAAERRIPFDRISGPPQYLVTFTGGDHMIFSGQRLRGPASDKDALFHDLIRQSTTAFWDAYLRGDAAARAWLADGGFAAVLGTSGVLEKKDIGEGRNPNVESNTTVK